MTFSAPSGRSEIFGRFFSNFSELLGMYKLTFPVFLMLNHQDQLFDNGEDTFEEEKKSDKIICQSTITILF